MRGEAEGVVYLDGKVDGIVWLAEPQAEGEQHGLCGHAGAEIELLAVAVFHAQPQAHTVLTLALNYGEQLRQGTVLGLQVQPVGASHVPRAAATTEHQGGAATKGGLQHGRCRHPLPGCVVAVRGAEVQVARRHPHLQPRGGP